MVEMAEGAMTKFRPVYNSYLKSQNIEIRQTLVETDSFQDLGQLFLGLNADFFLKFPTGV